MRALIISAALLAAATAAQAQSVVFGAGYADYTDDQSEDQGLVSIEYQHSPFHQATRFSARLGGAVEVTEDGDAHIGIGVIGIYTFSDRWFLEGSVMPGYYDASDPVNDLGGEFQIRSLFGVGYGFENGNKISLAITHKSNASTQDDNPGVDAVLLRYHLGF